MQIIFTKTDGGATEISVKYASSDNASQPSGVCLIPPQTSISANTDSDFFVMQAFPGNFLINGNPTLRFPTGSIDKTACSPQLTGTTTAELMNEIIDFFFSTIGGSGGKYKLATPSNVVASLGGNSTSVDVNCDAVTYTMGYTAEIATDSNFTTGLISNSSAVLPVNVPGAVAGNTYHARIVATTTNPGNINSDFAVAPGTVVIPEAPPSWLGKINRELYADLIVGNNNDPVSSVPDNTGSGDFFVASGAGIPLLKTNAVNGKKSISFNGTSNYLDFANGGILIKQVVLVLKINGTAPFPNYGCFVSSRTPVGGGDLTFGGEQASNNVIVNPISAITGVVNDYNNPSYGSTYTYYQQNGCLNYNKFLRFGDYVLVSCKINNSDDVNGYSLMTDRHFGNRWIDGELAYFASFDDYLTYQQESDLYTELRSRFATPLPNLFVQHGNSLGLGVGATSPSTDNMGVLVSNSLMDSQNDIEFHMKAIGGSNIAQHITWITTTDNTYPFTVEELVDRPVFNKIIVSEIEGTNQMANQPAGYYTTALSLMQTYVDDILALDPRTNVLLYMTPSADPTTVGANFEANRVAFNAGLLTMATTRPRLFIVNITGNSIFDNATSYQNTTYYYDGVHLTTLGYATLAALAEPIAASIL